MAKRSSLVWLIALAPMVGALPGIALAQTPGYRSYSYNDAPQPPAPLTGDATAPPAPAADAALKTADTAVAAAPCAACNSCGGSGLCGACFNWDQDTWVKVGAGLRVSFNDINQDLPAGPGGGKKTFDFFSPDNVRLYFNGQGHKVIGFELNTDIYDPNQTFVTPNDFAQIRLLDAIVKFQFDDLVNIWMGRLLPPSDRANLDGPFYINAWDFPFVSNYPSVFDGRENGAAYWGQLGGGIFKWQVGVFNGTQPTGSVPANSSDDLQFAGRLTLNLLDPEPGYYTQSTYYGKKDILAIGAAVMAQKNAVGTSVNPQDFVGWNIDFLFEKKLPNDGVFTLEGAYYNYNDHGVVGSANTAALAQQGTSEFVEFSYLLPSYFGYGKMCGQFQPFTRWQQYDHDFTAAAAGQFSEGVDVGTNYIISGHNARLTAFWGQRDVVGGGNYSLWRFGAQVQF